MWIRLTLLLCKSSYVNACRSFRWHHLSHVCGILGRQEMRTARTPWIVSISGRIRLVFIEHRFACTALASCCAHTLSGPQHSCNLFGTCAFLSCMKWHSSSRNASSLVLAGVIINPCYLVRLSPGDPPEFRQVGWQTWRARKRAKSDGQKPYLPLMHTQAFGTIRS